MTSAARPQASPRLKVALVEHPREPSWEHLNDIANAPLSSSLMTGYVAGALGAAGHDTPVVEGNLAGLSEERIVELVAREEPDVVGIHLVYDWSDGRRLASLCGALARTLGPVPLLTYGFYPTFAHADLLRALPQVSAVVVGEPELTFVQAVEVLARSDDRRAVRSRQVPRGARDLSAVAGLALPTDTGSRLTAVRSLVDDLDSLPFPFRTPEMLAMREVNIAGSRGCYGSCTFCTINPFYGGRSLWRPRSPRSVIAEMEALLEAHPEKDRFYFVDPNFFGPAPRGRARALELAHLIGERFQVRFGLEGRVNDIDEEIVEALVAVGFDEILIGLESGSDETLARLGKRTTVEQNRRALRILRAYGVEPNVGFIMFEPHSTLDDVRVNLEFLKEERLLDRLAVTANVLYHQQILLRPTPAYRRAMAEGVLQVSAHNPYEGTIPYRSQEVGFLAETMAEVCRHLFAGLPLEVWLETDGGGPGAARLAEVNRGLVRLFEDLLRGLTSGELVPGAELGTDCVAEGKRILAASAPA